MPPLATMVAEYCCSVWFGAVCHCFMISSCRKSPCMFCIVSTISFAIVFVSVVCVLMSLCSVICIVLVGVGMVCNVFSRAY